VYRLVVFHPAHVKSYCSFPDCNDIGILALRGDIRALAQSVFNSVSSHWNKEAFSHL
jgi:hypothetical protein